MAKKDYTIRQVGEEFRIYDHIGRWIDTCWTQEVADYAVRELRRADERRYIVTTGGGMFVGVFNYGRTYRAAEHPCVLNCDAKTARSLAETFGGKAYKLYYDIYDSRPWRLLADCGQFWQQTGKNYFYQRACINQLITA